jgi:hypothetical protein
VHLLWLGAAAAAGAPAAPTWLATQPVHVTEVTALSFAAADGSAAGSPSAELPLLAAGSERGAVKLLRVQQDGSMHAVATLADHKVPVAGVVLSAGGASLATADRDGRRLVYRWAPASGQLQVVAQCAAARGSCVSLMAGQCSGGQTVVAASKAGRVTMLDGAGREVSTLQLLDKNHGTGLCMQVLSPFHCLCVSSPIQAVFELAAFLPASLSLQAS